MGFTSEEEIDNVIRQCVGGAYTRDNLCWVLKINCRQISDNLKKYGIFQGKSGYEQPYNCQTPELEKAYIRGLIDGDGFITQDLKRCGIVGSQEVLIYIKNYLQKYVIDVSSNSINSHGSIFKLEFNGIIKTKTIITHFYKDATIYLDRKFDLFQKM